jgi:hypothetical protein
MHRVKYQFVPRSRMFRFAAHFPFMIATSFCRAPRQLMTLWTHSAMLSFTRHRSSSAVSARFASRLTLGAAHLIPPLSKRLFRFRAAHEYLIKYSCSAIVI